MSFREDRYAALEALRIGGDASCMDCGKPARVWAETGACCGDGFSYGEYEFSVSVGPVANARLEEISRINAARPCHG